MSIELTDRLPGVSFTLHALNPRHPRLALRLHAGESFRFGRRIECEQCFPSDHRISGVHASLRLDGGHVVLHDHSVNGTYVNSARLAHGTGRALEGGDSFYLVIPSAEILQKGYTGSLTQSFVGYLFELEPAPAAAPAALAADDTAAPEAEADRALAAAGAVQLAVPAAPAAAAPSAAPPGARRGLIPRSAPGALTDRAEHEACGPSASSIRQTTDASVLLAASDTAGLICGADGDEAACTAPAEEQHHDHVVSFASWWLEHLDPEQWSRDEWEPAHEQQSE